MAVLPADAGYTGTGPGGVEEGCNAIMGDEAGACCTLGQTARTLML